MDHKLTLRESIEREFRERIVFSAKDERETLLEVLTEKVNQFLALDIKDSNKYSEVVSEVMDDSVAYIHDWSPTKAASAFLSLMRYILNLLDQPYKKTFWTLKIYSGYYYLKVHQHLKDADRILFSVGYSMVDNNTLKLSLSDLVDANTQIKIACDCLIASSECTIIAAIWNSIKPLKYTFTDILTCRKSHPGSIEESVKWIKVNIPRQPVKKDTELKEQDKSRTSPTEDKRSKSAPSRNNTGATGSNINDSTIYSKQTQPTGTVFGGNVNQSGNQSPRESLTGNISQYRNKPSPPENLIEGTDEDHMQASLRAMKCKPVRAPTRTSSMGRADQVYRKIMDTKEITKDVILGDTKSPSDQGSSGIDVKTVTSKMTSSSPCTTEYQKRGTFGPSSMPVGEVFSYGGAASVRPQPLGTAREVSFEENQNTEKSNIRNIVSTKPVSTYSSSRYTLTATSSNVLSGQAAGVSDVLGTLAGSASLAKEKLPGRSICGTVYSGTHITVPVRSRTLPHTSTLSGCPIDYQTSSSRKRWREGSKSPEQPASLPVLRSNSLPPSWKCLYCTSENSYDFNICSVCHKSKSFDLEEETSIKWECRQCTYKNSLISKKCIMCGHTKPETTDTAV